MAYYDQVAEAAAYLNERLGSLKAQVGIVLGPGWERLPKPSKIQPSFPTARTPDFPQSTVEGHSGRMVAGQLGGAPVIIMQGRVHSYEGYSPLEVTFPMRVLGMLGIRAGVLTNAAGGIHPQPRRCGRKSRAHWRLLWRCRPLGCRGIRRRCSGR